MENINILTVTESRLFVGGHYGRITWYGVEKTPNVGQFLPQNFKGWGRGNLMSIDQNYTVSQKTVQNYFCQKFVKFQSIVKIFGTKMSKTIDLCEVHLFSTSPNLCQHSNDPTKQRYQKPL